MELNLQRFYRACNPAKTLAFSDEDDKDYYIDFSSLRGGNVIEKLERTITLISPNEPTCQLFTGHIGCGKSTELRQLESKLKNKNFHVVYFESTKDLDMADVDITDILLAITRQVSESLEKEANIRLLPNYFVRLFKEITNSLNTPIEVSEVKFSLPGKIAEITAKTKDSPHLRSQLRQFLEPRTNNILESINQEVLKHATEKLKNKGKEGLVVIVDNLDRVDNRAKTNARSQPEYLFIDRGDQLRGLHCHLVYTIPLSLIFSNESETLKNRLGGGVAPKVLPMVPVWARKNGGRDENGIALLRQMVLARAFPKVKPAQRLELITEVFDSPETLNRLCEISGGHVRNLLGLLYRCIQEEDPPISRECLEDAIRDYRDNLALAITEDEWELLRKVVKQQSVEGEADYQTLLRSLFVFEYQDKEGRWFGINPVLAENNKFQLQALHFEHKQLVNNQI